MADLQEIKGRVGNVCKEWLVREDGALAYQLQSREINDHYKGNRHRNAIVRQDFPTALMEQIKEKENAERQAQIYHQMVNEQEEQDARYAQEISAKLKKESEAQKKLFEEKGEQLARRLQEQAQIGHNVAAEQTPMPPRNHPKPNAKKQAAPEQYVLPDSPTPFNGSSGHLHYASLDLSAGAVLKNSGDHAPNRPPKTNSSTSTPEKTKYAQINLHSHTPDKNPANNVLNHLQQSQTPYLTSNDDFLQQSAVHGYHPNGVSQQQRYPQNQYQEQQRQVNDDICDSIRQYDMPIDEYQYDDDSYQLPVNSNYNDLYKAGRNNQTDAFKQSNPTSAHPLNLNFNAGDSHGHFSNGNGHAHIQKNVPENYSRPDRSSNHSSESNVRHGKPVNGNANLPPLVNEEAPPRPPPPSKKQLQQLNQQQQQNSNVISNADDIDRIRTLQELGLPADEIQEIDRRITQEQKDEELARQLQDQESGGFDQEDRDRMLAIEAQDKELAKMLQERERAKAKRAKEKAKIKKEMLRQQQLASGGSNSQLNQSLESDEAAGAGSKHPGDVDRVAYSSPVDTLSHIADGNYRRYEQSTPPKESISPDQQYFNHRHQPSYTSQGSVASSGGHSGLAGGMPVTEESYSNPLDLVPQQNHQPQMSAAHQQHTGLGNGSGRRRDDDNIYILPVDDQNALAGYKAARPNHLDIRVTSKPSPPKAHLPEDNIAAMIDPTFGTPSSTPTPSNGMQSRLTPDLLEYSEPSSTSPVPPYMPIQGTRRNASLDKKKKSKDRCAQQ